MESLLEGTEATIWFLEESTIASIATTVTLSQLSQPFLTIDVSLEELMKEMSDLSRMWKRDREPGKLDR
ncbi:MAG: hypothetical protein CM15mP49_08700 [Actinomycetota bacterium]|nr:MAG: hypothetical protein CM15mP49_08700 [Actinomycetota bacterium]